VAAKQTYSRWNDGRCYSALAVVCVGLLLPLNGCRVGPNYKVPATATAPSFKEADTRRFPETADWHLARPGDTIPRGDWWTIFHDDALNTLEPQIATANQTLMAADANLRAARAAITVQHSGLLPTVGVAPHVIGERESANQPFTTGTGTNSGEADYLIAPQLNYEVDLWGAIHRSVTAAREEAQASAADRQSLLLSLQAELAVDYFELRAADAQQRLLDQTVAQYADAVRVTRNRFLGGIAGKSDLTQAETQLQAAKVADSDVVVARAQYEHAIAALLGKTPSDFSLPPTPFATSTEPPAIPLGLPSELLERRPDVAAAERRTAEANEQIGIARAAYFPAANILGSAGVESAVVGSLFSAPSFLYAVGPILSQTLFDGGRRRGISAEAQANYDAATATYRQTVLTAYQQVEDNLVALRVLSTESDQQRQATASALESERIFNNRYVGGVDNYLQVILAQTTALVNERNDIDILRRRMDASVILIKALGGGWDRTQLPTQ
jgi:NodT family efflux transporter outer membrane factor (OMF) lipoprotein